MLELPVDTSVANRFISSLSKSLQALCHGCMDFDSGIEIVGYINVNIDSGGKVDYVLNEKVQKSTNNSMTFVSNSFLAQKYQSIQTRDGTCSPIQELQLYHSTAPQKRSNHLSSHHRYIHSTPSNILRGSKKRAWSGIDRDWRGGQKKQPRIGTFSHHQLSYDSSAHSNPMSQDFQSSSGDTSFQHQPETPSSASLENRLCEVNVKCEPSEDESQKSCVIKNSQNLDNGYSSNLFEDHGNVKSEPDKTILDENTRQLPYETEEPCLDSGLSDDKRKNNKSISNESQESNIPRNLSTKENNSFTGQHPSGISAFDSFENNTATGNLQPSEGTVSGEGPPVLDHQFDVIEIGDEDEDVQAMFGDKSTSEWWPSVQSRRQDKYSKETFKGRLEESLGNERSLSRYGTSSHLSEWPCPVCGTSFHQNSMLMTHISIEHPKVKNAFPFNCHVCQKGFFSQTGLNHHMEKHSSTVFSCYICSKTFTYSRNLKRHLEINHCVKECRYCKEYIETEMFNHHAETCQGLIQWKNDPEKS